MMRTNAVLILALLAAGTLSALAAAAEQAHVVPLDLTGHAPTDKLTLKRVADGEFEWRLPDGASQALHVDLRALGIDPSKFDEFRFDIKPMGSQVGLQTIIYGLPADGKLSSWYLKFKAPREQWSEGRYDLHVDDDGIFLGSWAKRQPAGTLEMRLYRRILGFPGEPRWRTAMLLRPRLVRHLIDAKFDLRETEIAVDAGQVAYTYKLHVENRTGKPRTVKLDADSARTLKYFSVKAPAEFALAAGEKKTVPIRIVIGKMRALAMAPLYSEPLYPKVYLDGVPDSDVIPLMGYRRFAMWGVIPIFNRWHWTPASLQAHLEARKHILPYAGWKAGVLRHADTVMPIDWPLPIFPDTPAHNQGYRCQKCGVWLTPASPTEFDKHVCPKCHKVFKGDVHLKMAWFDRYLAARCNDMKTLGWAWLLTGKEAYAEKALRLLEKFADAAPRMPVRGMRSTSGAGRLGLNTLMVSYKLRTLSEAWNLLSTAPGLDDARRAKIERFLIDEAVRDARHSVEYSNQEAEHAAGYGGIGIVTGFWPLAGEALYGEFGFHELVEYGYSEDGIGHESGGYHRAIWGAMNGLATVAWDNGVNLYTARFKRVFDGSLIAGESGVSYELAYRAYREPAYLPVLAAWRKRQSEDALLHGVLGLPSSVGFKVKSALMAEAGYVFLRTGTAADSREIQLNYIKPFGRTEQDRFGTYFLRNGQPVDGQVGRITYGDPRSHWMYETAAHNTIVVDGGDQRLFDGRLIAFDDSPHAPIAVVGIDPPSSFYPGVRQVRGVAIAGDCYVVFDRLSADNPHTFDRYQYGRDQAKLRCRLSPAADPVAGIPKAGEFTQIQSGPCGKTLRADFKNGLKMHLVSDRDMQAFKAVTVGGYQAQPMEVTWARVSGAKDVTFAAAFSFGADAAPPEIVIVSSSADGITLRLKAEKQSYKIAADLKRGAATVTPEPQ